MKGFGHDGLPCLVQFAFANCAQFQVLYVTGLKLVKLAGWDISQVNKIPVCNTSYRVTGL